MLLVRKVRKFLVSQDIGQNNALESLQKGMLFQRAVENIE